MNGSESLFFSVCVCVHVKMYSLESTTRYHMMVFYLFIFFQKNHLHIDWIVEMERVKRKKLNVIYDYKK